MDQFESSTSTASASFIGACSTIPKSLASAVHLDKFSQIELDPPIWRAWDLPSPKIDHLHHQRPPIFHNRRHPSQPRLNPLLLPSGVPLRSSITNIAVRSGFYEFLRVLLDTGWDIKSNDRAAQVIKTVIRWPYGGQKAPFQGFVPVS